MKLHLPNSAFLGNIDPFLRSFSPSEPGKLEITANKKWISVHPMVLAMVAALGLKVDSKKIVCEPFEARSKHYFERMGLFRMLGLDSGIKMVEHEQAGRFIPLTQIRDSEDLKEFITEMIPLLHLDPSHADSIKYVVSELIRNVLEHAESPQGAILAAQYYPVNKVIRIGVADTGLGIKNTIRNAYPQVKNDIEAIRLALMPGVTGTTSKEGGTERNAGAGLFFVKSIAKVNRDFFVIYSGDAMYKLLKSQTIRTKLYGDPFDDEHSKKTNFPSWNGTVVGIDITLEATEGFTKLLDLIRATYQEAIAERKLLKRKKPKFI